MQKHECIAMLLAGGQGSRLGPLTRNIAKPAVSFCGKYRIIDFSLSNCAKSNINTVGVLTQYKPFLLNSYIELGSAWDLDTPMGGVHILPPYMGEAEGSWYKGTANAVFQNFDFINFYNPKYVLIISGDHIYTMDYNVLLQYHKKKGSEITISTIEVNRDDISRFGILTVDEDGKILKFEEKPSDSESNLASMGVYIFDWPVLKQALLDDVQDYQSENDFGKNIIPKALKRNNKVYAYKFEGYWRDVGTIDSFYQANMECLRGEDSLDIFDPKYRIYSNEDILPPQFIGTAAKVKDSLICNGSTILGEVNHSIVAPGVYIGQGAVVEDSILLPHSKILDHSIVRKTIVGENAVVMSHCLLGHIMDNASKQDGITVIENDYVIEEGSLIEAGNNIYRVS